MDRPTFLRRLAAIGKTQHDIADALGQPVTTVYNFARPGHPIPRYAEPLLAAWETIHRLSARLERMDRDAGSFW
jgi:hypothetical protein